MSVFVILDINVTDWDIFPEYRDSVKPVVEKYGGRYLAKGGEVTTLFGHWDINRIVIVEFPTKQHLQDCIASPEYIAAKAIRDRSAQTRAIVVEGTDPDIVS